MPYLEHSEHLSLLTLAPGCALWSHRQIAQHWEAQAPGEVSALEHEAQVTKGQSLLSLCLPLSKEA